MKFWRSLLPLFALLGCSRADDQASKLIPEREGGEAEGAVPQITVNAEDGFIDLTFVIVQRERTKTGGEWLLAAGLDEVVEVELGITLQPDWEEALLDGLDLITHQGAVSIQSTGAASDALVQAMDRLYSTGAGARTMKPETQFTGISLRGDPGNLDAGSTRIKLFFESEEEGLYAELFLNIDVGTQTINLNEKDPDYRSAVIAALRGVQSARK